jgi:hypothetical protein
MNVYEPVHMPRNITITPKNKPVVEINEDLLVSLQQLDPAESLQTRGHNTPSKEMQMTLARKSTNRNDMN